MYTTKYMQMFFGYLNSLLVNILHYNYHEIQYT